MGLVFATEKAKGLVFPAEKAFNLAGPGPGLEPGLEAEDLAGLGRPCARPLGNWATVRVAGVGGVGGGYTGFARVLHGFCTGLHGFCTGFARVLHGFCTHF